MHLNADQLIDLAEGASEESSAPHLSSCAACRQQLSDLRAMMTAVSDVDVPEPSPLFWNHLSGRVSEAIAAEPARRNWWSGALSWPQVLMPAASLVAALLVVGLLVNGRGPASTMNDESKPAVADVLPSRELLSETGSLTTDPSLSLVADLTRSMDAESAGEAGLAASGSAEHAVVHLSDSELRELRRLLAEELTHTGN